MSNLLPASAPPTPVDSRRPLWRRAWRRLRAKVFEEQVAMRLPTRLSAPPPNLGPAFQLKSASPVDYLAWIALLNSDNGFGHWDLARLERDITAHLLTPHSAVLLYHEGSLVGCAAMCLADFRGLKHPTGMFLIIDTAFRGQFRLSVSLYRETLEYAAQAGYEAVYVTTFPDRSSALALYLAHGATPVHTHLWSRVQWRRINKRIAPIVARLRRRF